MKNNNRASSFPSLIIRAIIGIAMCGLFLIVTAHQIYGQQWTQSIGVGNSFIGCIASSRNNLIAGGGASTESKGFKDSIFISTNNGNAWSIVSDSVPLVITSMAVVGTDILVASDKPGGAYYSSDLGTTWNPNVTDFPYPFLTDNSFS